MSRISEVFIIYRVNEDSYLLDYDAGCAQWTIDSKEAKQFANETEAREILTRIQYLGLYQVVRFFKTY